MNNAQYTHYNTTVCAIKVMSKYIVYRNISYTITWGLSFSRPNREELRAPNHHSGCVVLKEPIRLLLPRHRALGARERVHYGIGFRGIL